MSQSMRQKRTFRQLATLIVAGVLVVSFPHVNPAGAQQSDAAEVMLQSAIQKELVEGDLESAIDIYERILVEFPDNRAVSAQAQLHIGLCYEKLGLTDAQRAYQRVIDGYPERQEEVAVARERLAKLTLALAELSSKPSFRKIEIASKPQNGVLSPDGTKLAFVSEEGVWVVPLHGDVDPGIAGEPIRIAEVPGAWDEGNLIAWSADGEWIAANGGTDVHDNGAGTDVYVIPAGGGDPRLVRVPNRGGQPWSYRVSLSPDGQRLAFSGLELGTLGDVPEGEARYIYSMPTVGGEPAQLSSDWGRLPSYSPDGELIAYVGYRERDDWPENTERSRYDGDLWIALSTGASPVKLATVDGHLAGPVWSPDGKYIAAQHHAPGTGGSSNEIWVFPLSPDASSAGEPTKIVLPGEIWNMVSGWTPDDELGVFIQSESHQAIYTVPASGGRAVQVMPDAPWAWYPRWSPDGERIYLRAPLDEAPHVVVHYVPAAGGEPVGVPLQAERELVTRVPGGGLNFSPDGGRIVVSGAQLPFDPEEGVDVWTFPLDGGPPTRLTSDGSFEGYPCWSPDGKWVAFTDWHEKSEEASLPLVRNLEDGFEAIYVVPAEGGEIRQISSESDSVGGGAIAFSPDSERIAFFSDGAIKTIRIDGGQSQVLVAEVQSGGQSDLAWSPDGAKIAYSGGGEIWIAPVGGGAPEELRTGLLEGTSHGAFSWSPDGEKIAFVGWIGGEAEFWLISDFLSPEK